jgi:hypothetical protein
MVVFLVCKLVTPVKQMVLAKLSVKGRLRFSLVQKEHKIIMTEFCHFIEIPGTFLKFSNQVISIYYT